MYTSSTGRHFFWGRSQTHSFPSQKDSQKCCYRAFKSFLCPDQNQHVLPAKDKLSFWLFFFFWLFRVCILTPAAPGSHKSSHRPSGHQGRGASWYSFIYTDGGGWPPPRAASSGGPEAASPGNLLEMQNLSTHPRPRNLKLRGGTHRLIIEEFWSSSFRTSALENQQDWGTDPEPRMSTLQLHTTVHRGEPRSGAVCDKTRVLT